MIDLAYDYNKPQREACECGEPECLGDAKWFAEATADIAMQTRRAGAGSWTRRCCGWLRSAMKLVSWSSGCTLL
jgi:hypothetical protein